MQGALLVTPKTMDLDVFSALWYLPYADLASQKIGYAITDLDGASRKELVLGTMDENGNGTIIDLYTCYEGSVYHVAAAGERETIALTNRGQIVEQGSGGAANSMIAFYSIGKTQLQPETAFMTDNGKGFKNFYGDHTADTPSSVSAMMMSPSGFMLNLIKHIK